MDMGLKGLLMRAAVTRVVLTAIQATRKWGKIALVGEGGTLALSPSP